MLFDNSLHEKRRPAKNNYFILATVKHAELFASELSRNSQRRSDGFIRTIFLSLITTGNAVMNNYHLFHHCSAFQWNRYFVTAAAKRIPLRAARRVTEWLSNCSNPRLFASAFWIRLYHRYNSKSLVTRFKMYYINRTWDWTQAKSKVQILLKYTFLFHLHRLTNLFGVLSYRPIVQCEHDKI